MVKEIETPYSIIKNFDEAKEILLSLESDKRYTNIEQDENSGKCIVKVNLPGCKPYIYSLESDFEIYFAGERDFNMYVDYYRTEELRHKMTKKKGKVYVDGLEKFLDNKTKKEVAKYRELLEDEVK